MKKTYRDSIGECGVVLRLEYEGTRYHGFQAQITNPTVQGVVEEAIRQLTGLEHRIEAAGRTDAGVHAAGQMISLLPRRDVALKAYVGGLNHCLPADIAVKSAHWSPSGLDVRRSAISRTYRYTILNERGPSPLWRQFAFTVRGALDTERMSHAAATLLGQRDFSPFAGALGSRLHGIRRMDRVMIRRDGNLVTLDFEANGFLPQQVRRTVGALVQVGLGRMCQEEFRAMLYSGQPGAARWVMPAQGLCLMHVRYPGFPPEDYDGED